MSTTNTAVITGSTGGIGGEIAELLAKDGWNLTIVNRSADKAAAQEASLKAAFPGLSIVSQVADLADQNQIKTVAQDIRQTTPQIDALYNISGVLTSTETYSAQGFEIHYAVNVLANYLMTQALRPALKRPASDQPSMVVTMSSSSINGVRQLDVETLHKPEKLGLLGAYASSKMALTMMGASIADDLKADNILIRSVDPGATLTPMTQSGDGMPTVLRWLAPLLFSKPDKQAAKIVAAAQPSQFDGRTGIMVAGGKERPLPKLAKDTALREALMAKIAKDSSNA